MATRKLGLSDLLNAVYDHLNSHASTSSYRIYDYVPPNTAWPYIKIGPVMGTESADFSSKDTEAEDNMAMINIWSKYAGEKEVADMMADVVDAMEDGFTITGYNIHNQVLDYSEIVIHDEEPAAGIKYQGIIRYRIDASPS